MYIESATLLSVEEAEEYLTKEERKYGSWWWLRSPGYDSNDAADVGSGGSVDYGGSGVNYGSDYVRPALTINLESSPFKIGDTFEFGGKTFKIISDKLAFCLEDIGFHCFREDWKASDANVYDVSDVKRYVDEWFEKASSVIDKKTSNTFRSECISDVNKELEVEKYSQRLLDEYTDLSDKIDSLYKLYARYKVNQHPHLTDCRLPVLKYPIALLGKQYEAMKDYQLYLRLRLLAEGIDPEAEVYGEEFDF